MDGHDVEDLVAVARSRRPRPRGVLVHGIRDRRQCCPGRLVRRFGFDRLGEHDVKRRFLLGVRFSVPPLRFAGVVLVDASVLGAC